MSVSVRPALLLMQPEACASHFAPGTPLKFLSKLRQFLIELTPDYIASIARHRPRHIAIPQLFAAILFTCSLSAHAVFTTPGQFNVSPSGAATYSIPIQVPPGTAGMAPKLSLNYNSQGGNGILGLGWGLEGLSQISRCPRTIVQDGAMGGINYDANDKYCIDGQRLIASAGTYGSDGTQYRTELANFAKIISYGTAGNGPAWFKVWTKGGQIIEYGNTQDSRIEAAGITTVRTWGVNKISDTKGNYITVTYIEDNPNGEAYISQIDYTGNASATPALTPYASVKFTYETRPDPSIGYHAGSIIKSTKRMTNIKTYNNSTTLVKDYRLTFELGTATNRSRLKTLTECDGTTPTPNCLQSVALGWQDTLTLFNPVVYANPNGWNFDTPISSTFQTITGDFNGDGKLDFIRLSPNVAYVFLSNGDGTFTGSTIGYPNGWNFGLPNSNWETITGDFNGDGKTDFARFTGTTGYVFLSNGDGTFRTVVYANPNGWNFDTPISSTFQTITGDFNGDGKLDFIRLSPNVAYVFLSNGDGTFTGSTIGYPNGWNFGLPNSNWETITGDFNGDGKLDFIRLSPNVAYVFLSNGDGTFTGSTIGYPNGWNFGLPNSNWETITGDFNGDGKTDFARFTGTSGFVFMIVNQLPDFLTSLATGLGSVTTITYKPLTDNTAYTKDNDAVYPIQDVQAPVYVVSSVTSSDGIGGTITSNYTYGGLKVSLDGRGSLGFRWMKLTDPDSGFVSTTFNNQVYPYIGLPSQSEKRTLSGNVLLSAQANTYANTPLVSGSATSQFPTVSQTLEQNFELDGSLITSTTTSYQYDAYGNVTQVTVTGNDGFVKTTTNTYNNDEANWLLGRLLRSTVTSTTP